MTMRYFAADAIHDGLKFLADDTIIAIQDDGTFDAFLSVKDIDPVIIQNVEGILCPGFINAHCHVELSHLKGIIPENTGLIEFVKQIGQQRNIFAQEAILLAAEQAYQSMRANGIVAVGDIANTTDTLHARSSAKMHIHSFIETMGFVPDAAKKRFAYSKSIWDAYQQASRSESGHILSQSIVPHAPYSVSKDLFELINQFDSNTLLSIHNQESQAETDYYYDKSGDINTLFQLLGIPNNVFEAPRMRSLAYVLQQFTQAKPLILVHNTFSNEEDIVAITQYPAPIYFCLCPNANWYIERKLPDINLLIASGVDICLGTDSLASNHSLDILSEIRKINDIFPSIGMESLLRFACFNGAKALQLENLIGSFAFGKKSGLNCISNDYANVNLVLK